jgi:hypothetical protein
MSEPQYDTDSMRRSRRQKIAKQKAFREAIAALDAEIEELDFFIGEAERRERKRGDDDR